jgi:hydroxymethylglutaryl-CoA lyase
MDIETGIDLDKLIAVSRRVQEIIGRTLPGQIAKAGKSDRRYPLPDSVMGDARRTPQALLAPGAE